jgi:hypothetical protein
VARKNAFPSSHWHQLQAIYEAKGRKDNGCGFRVGMGQKELNRLPERCSVGADPEKVLKLMVRLGIFFEREKRWPFVRSVSSFENSSSRCRSAVSNEPKLLPWLLPAYRMYVPHLPFHF